MAAALADLEADKQRQTDVDGERWTNGILENDQRPNSPPKARACQQKTKRFSGPSDGSQQKSQWAEENSSRYLSVPRKVVGDWPVNSRKTRLKWVSD